MSLSTSSKLDRYTRDPIGPTLAKMAFHMSFGFMAMSVFNLTDTYFVSRLGTTPLAAMGFTQPLVFLFFSILFGLGIATSAVISRAVGGGDNNKLKRLTTDALLLAFITAASMSVMGLNYITHLLDAMGATGEALELSKGYMMIWMFGFPFGVLPMVGNNAIRSCGNTVAPAIIMSTSAILNMVLDPIFIFGLGPVPAMGIKGAALATIISRMLSVAAALYIIGFRLNLLSFTWPGFAEILKSWASLLHTAAPASATHICMPFSMAVVTGFASQYGEEVVAALGAATRFEGITLIPVMSLSMVLLPFMGQNFGRKKFDRIFKALSLVKKFMLGWGIFVTVVMCFASSFVSTIFSKDPIVLENIKWGLIILTASHGLVGFGMSAGNGLNAVGSPVKAAIVTFLRSMVLNIPMAWLGGKLYGPMGLFGGMAAARIIAGLMSQLWLSLTIKQKAASEVIGFPVEITEDADPDEELLVAERC